MHSSAPAHRIAHGQLAVRRHPLGHAIRLALIGMAFAVPAAALLHAGSVQAQTSAAKQQYRIAAGPLGAALSEFAAAAGVTLSTDAEQTRGLQSAGLHGTYSVSEGFSRLLGGSGLQAVPQDNGSYVLRRAPATDGAATLPAVSVTGNAYDATTEGSGSYAARAATIGLGNQTLRETPNSVSVITRQRLDDQNLVTIEDAMQYVTAMKVTTYGTNNFNLESRGYAIDRYQIDGVSSSARVYENNFGLAMFDRIEIWRGPAGLLQGSGDPGGTVNMVRKRAQKDFGFNAKASAGSWNNFYADADVTGALNEEGTLRGRAVVAYQDRDYYVDHADSRQPMFYGTLEYDFTPDTTLSVGSSWQRTRNRPFYGIAGYVDGGYPDVSRSTYLGALWARNDQRTQRHFAELEHRFDNGGKAILSANYLDRHNAGEISWGNSYVDRATGNVEMIPYFSTGDERESNLHGRVVLPVTWRNLPQEFVFGASYQKFNNRSAYNADTWGQNGVPQNIFDPDPNLPKPDLAQQVTNHGNQIQQSVFGQARIKPLEQLTLLAGTRVAWYETQNLLNRANDNKVDAKTIPYAGIIYDLNTEWSAYGSYSSIFNPQTNRDRSGAYLKPREGKQFELGMKGEHLGGKLNSSFALYRIEDENRAMTDPDFPAASIAAGKVRSEGMEAELSGQFSPRWNFTAGYGYNRTKLLRAAPAQEGKPFTTLFPRHTFSLWNDYRFDNGFSLGGGVRVRSAIHTTNNNGVRWGQGGFALFSAQAGYQLTQQVRLSLTINNIFDRHYIDRPAGSARQTYFGEPRSVMLTVAYKM